MNSSSAPAESASGKRKTSSAFRTIGEVAADLGVPPHVLRFWESKFSQIKPHKRRGGHRYYRPADVEILHEIKSLLYERGYTIKGAQKYLKEAKQAGTQQGTMFEEEAVAAVQASNENQDLSKKDVAKIKKVISGLQEVRNILTH